MSNKYIIDKGVGIISVSYGAIVFSSLILFFMIDSNFQERDITFLISICFFNTTYALSAKYLVKLPRFGGYILYWRLFLMVSVCASCLYFAGALEFSLLSSTNIYNYVFIIYISLFIIGILKFLLVIKNKINESLNIDKISANGIILKIGEGFNKKIKTEDFFVKNNYVKLTPISILIIIFVIPFLQKDYSLSLYFSVTLFCYFVCFFPIYMLYNCLLDLIFYEFYMPLKKERLFDNIKYE